MQFTDEEIGLTSGELSDADIGLAPSLPRLSNDTRPFGMVDDQGNSLSGVLPKKKPRAYVNVTNEGVPWFLQSPLVAESEQSRFNLFNKYYPNPTDITEGVVNALGGAGRTALSPVGIATAPLMSEAVVGQFVANLAKAAAGGMGAAMLGETAGHYAGIPEPTAGDKTEALINTLFGGAMMLPLAGRTYEVTRGNRPSPYIPPVVDPPGLPGPRRHVYVDPLGQAMVQEDFTPAEWTEAMRGPREYVPREKYVRPAQASPVILGEQQPVIDLPMIIESVTQRNPPPSEPGIMGVPVPTKPPIDPGAGQVSFGAPAQAGSVPSARQAISGPSRIGEQQALMEGMFIPRAEKVVEPAQKPMSVQQVSPRGGKEVAKPTGQAETLPVQSTATGGVTPNIPALIPGERLVTIQRPDGTTYPASFGDKYWDIPSKGKLASIGRITPGTDKWSHGMLEPGEKIIENVGQPIVGGQNAGAIRSNQAVIPEQAKQEGQTQVLRQGSGEPRSEGVQRSEGEGKQGVRNVEPDVEMRAEYFKPDPEEMYGQAFEDYKARVAKTRNRMALEATLEDWANQPKTPREQEAVKLIQKRLAELEAEQPKTSKPWPPPQKYPEWTPPPVGEGKKFSTPQPTGGEMGVVSEVLGRIAKNKQSKYSGVAEALSKLGDEAGMKVRVRLDKLPAHVLGRYSPALDLVQIAEGRANDDWTIVHEILHAFTNKKLSREITGSYQGGKFHQEALDRYLTNGKDENVKQIIRLYKQAQADLPAEVKTHYGMSDLQEFISEGYSNPEFQARLNDIKWKDSKKGLWEKLKEAFRKLLGFKADVESLFSELVDHISQVVKRPRPAEGEAVGSETSAPDVYSEKSPTSEKMFDISKDPGKFSMFEKDRPAAREARLYMNPVGPMLKQLGKDVGEVAKGTGKLAAGALRFYAEPLVERLARLGGVVSKKVSAEARNIIRRGKEIYGTMTPTLDPARQAMGKRSEGSTWFRQLNEVTPNAAYNNFFGANEKAVTVPAPSAEAHRLADIANFDIGVAAKKANPDFDPHRKLQRIRTGFGYDIILRGPGSEAWMNETEGVAKLNNKPVEEVRKFYKQWKAELDAPGADATHLDRISQDFVRRFPRTVTHVKSQGAWHEVIVADPFNYLEAAAQRTAHAVAFREVYKLIRGADGKYGPSGLLESTRKAVMAELKTDVEGKEFDNLMRALQGHPLDSFTKGWNAPDTTLGGGYRMAGSLIASPLKTLMLSANALANAGEVVTGGPAIFLGYKNLMPAMVELAKNDALYPQLEASGAVNKAMWNMAHDPSQKVRSTIRTGSNLVRKYTGQQALNELQEAQAAASAKHVANRIRGKGSPLTEYEKNRLKVVSRAMGFTREQAQGLVNGDEALLRQFETQAAAWLTAGNQAMGELSRAGASRAFNSLFWFHRYGQMTTNQLRKVTSNLWDDVKRYQSEPTSENLNDVKHGATLLSRLIGGRTLQGVIYTAILAAIVGGKAGLEEKSNEVRDEPFNFAIDSFLSGLSGPLGIARKISQNSVDSSTLESNLVGLMPPAALTKDIIDGALGLGRYKGKQWDEKLGGFLDSKTPGFKVIRSGLAIAGLSQEDRELKVAMNAFYRWRKSQPGYAPPGPVAGTDEEAELRNAMRKVRVAIENGQDWMKVLKEIETTNRKAARSLYAGTLLEINGKPLSEEQVKKLSDHIGAKFVKKIQTRDAMIREVARNLSKGEVVEKPTGKFAIDAETPSKRSERVKASLSKSVLKLLDNAGVESLTFTPDLARGRKEKLMTTEQSKVMEEEFSKIIEEKLMPLTTDLVYLKKSQENQRRKLETIISDARVRAQIRAKRRLKEQGGLE